jgi:hypothetical protein
VHVRSRSSPQNKHTASSQNHPIGSGISASTQDLFFCIGTL